MALSAFAAAGTCPHYEAEAITYTSSDADGLQATVDHFRQLLGSKNNGNAPGPLHEGHRSVNWDGAGVPFEMPGDFFKVNVPRGLETFVHGDAFRVSNPNNEPDVDNLFDSVNPEAAKDFVAFTPNRLFTGLKGNVMRAEFTVPGRGDPATVSGFGAVFVDVDQKGTAMVFVDEHKCLIKKVNVPVKKHGLSFAGIVVTKKDGRPLRRKTAIQQVQMRLGNQIIDGGIDDEKKKKDIVVLDDFIYGEPQPIW